MSRLLVAKERKLSTQALLLGLVVGPLTSGCHWRDRHRPVSAAVVNCREFAHQGLAAVESGDWETAEQRFQQAVRTDPSDPIAQRHYAEALWQKEDRSGAFHHLSQAITLTPDDAGLRLQMARWLHVAGHQAEALSHVDEALELNPGLAEGWTLRGELATNPRQALTAYYRALRYNPRCGQTLLRIGRLHNQLGQPRRALATAQQANSVYPPGEEPQELLILHGEAQLALGQLSEAAGSLQLAAKQGPLTPEICYLLAETQLAAGQTQLAQRTLSQSLRVAPQDHRTLALLKRIQSSQRGAFRPQAMPRESVRR